MVSLNTIVICVVIIRITYAFMYQFSACRLTNYKGLLEKLIGKYTSLYGHKGSLQCSEYPTPGPSPE
jgi:hypothetical protein